MQSFRSFRQQGTHHLQMKRTVCLMLQMTKPGLSMFDRLVMKLVSRFLQLQCTFLVRMWRQEHHTNQMKMFVEPMLMA
jgi:hypothetical protein